MAIAIDKPSKYFNTVLYNGTGSSQSITGVGFKPDLVYVKVRNDANVPLVFDSVRGVLKEMYTSLTNAETTANGVSAFNTDGFSVSTDNGVNRSGYNFVAWNWLGANTTASNTSGTITSTVSANTTSGFSIVSYTANQASTATVGHGLGVAPSMIIVKERSGTADWMVYHKSVGTDGNLKLNTTNAKLSSTIVWRSTSPTSTVFTLGEDGGDYQVNYPSGATYIAYCFAEVKGFSKFGSYTGNGSTDGTFVYTGFKPAWLMVKRTDTADGWTIVDNKRNTYNLVTQRLKAEAADAESALDLIDFTSNGFKNRNSYVSWNASGGTYIYMAFSENPFTSSKGIPCTAR